MAVLQIVSKYSHTNVYAPLFRRSAPCHEPLSTFLRWILIFDLMWIYMMNFGRWRGGKRPSNAVKCELFYRAKRGRFFCLCRNPEQQKNGKSAGLFALADSEHLGAAGRTDALSCRSSIFHGDFLRVFHFSLGFAFNAISFHLVPPLIGFHPVRPRRTIINDFVPVLISEWALTG